MSTQLAILLGVCVVVVVGLVVAVAALGVDRFVAVWNRIPKSLRTIANVAVGAAFAGLLSYVLQHAASWNLPPEVKVLLIGVFTAIFRQVNPGDANPQVIAPTPGE